jgi:FkbM family methyltransferase
MNKIFHAIAIFRLYRNPWLRYLDYLKMLPEQHKYRARLRNGLQLLVRACTGDFQVIDEIFIHKVYDYALSRLSEGDIVIDIGAHIGVFTLASALRGASVLCFEPFPENFDLLVENIKLNGYLERIQAYRFAVTGTSGERTLYTITGDTGGGTLFPSVHSQWAKWQDPQAWRAIKVQCITLDDILENRVHQCDLLKMDCEGAEEEIILHIRENNLKKVKSIVMEYHAGVNVEHIRNKLESAGFKLNFATKGFILFASRDRSL